MKKNVINSRSKKVRKFFPIFLLICINNFCSDNKEAAVGGSSGPKMLANRDPLRAKIYPAKPFAFSEEQDAEISTIAELAASKITNQQDDLAEVDDLTCAFAEKNLSEDDKYRIVFEYALQRVSNQTSNVLFARRHEQRVQTLMDARANASSEELAPTRLRRVLIERNDIPVFVATGANIPSSEREDDPVFAATSTGIPPFENKH